MSKGMLAALLLSVMLAVSLSFLPDRALDRWGGEAFLKNGKDVRDVPVARMEGVVDELGQLQLTSRLRKVSWEGEKLVVWLSVPSSSLQQKRPWQDVYRVLYRFLVGVPQNNGTVEVRVVTHESPERVALAVFARSSDMTDAPKPDSKGVETFVRTHLLVQEMGQP
jgi:hypothetical protein